MLHLYQLEAADAVFGYFERGGAGHPLIVMPTGCHQKGTEILMFDGSLKPVEEVSVGDEVMGPDSEPRTVLCLARGRDKMYRITPKRGTPFVVNGEHILSLATTNEGKAFACKTTGKEIDNISINDYLKKSKSWKHLRKIRRVSVNFSHRERPSLSPWALGAFIGDGCLVKGISFTSPDLDIMDALYEEMVFFGLKCFGKQKKDSPAWSIGFGVKKGISKQKNQVWKMLEYLGLAGLKSSEKFIPDCYKLGSREDRFDILAGLLDTDGHLSRNTYDYISKSKRLSEDVAFIAKSLGLRATVSECEKYCQTGVGGTYWRVCISGNTDMIPMRCERKRALPRRQKKNPLCDGFSIDELPEDNFYGFFLSGDHLYLTGDFVVHHNSGKSWVLAELARRVVVEHDSRVVVLAHRKELLEQNADKLARMSPDLDIGAYSAGLNARDKDSDVLYCGIQSVYDKARSISNKSKPIELVFVDEAHLVPFGSGGMYRRFLDDLTRVNPHLRVIGCTATPWRYRPGTKEMSGGYDDLTGDGGVFTDVVYDCSAKIGEMIEAGYLAPLWPSATGYRVDAEKVATRNGDYCADELEALMSGGEVVSGIVEDAVPRARADGRKSWLVFCSGVKSALSTMEALRAHGVCAACVTGETPAFERDGAIEMFRGGRLEALVSVNALGVGFDAPNADCLIVARPTVSPIIHCLDEKTEILTSHGWKKMGEIKVGDCVPSMDMETWKGKWTSVISTIERETTDGERFCSFEAPRANFRVTENHNMIISTQYKNKKHTQFKIIMAADMAKKGGLVFMPTAVHMDTPGVPLSQWELYFIGMVLTDGSITNQSIHIYQSERHPEIISRIDECLENCGLAYVKRRVCTKEGAIKEVNKRWVWTISIARTNRIKNGIAKRPYKHDAVIKEGIGASYLLPYLDKNIAGALLNCTKEQFDMLFKGIWDGDGFKTSKCPSVDWNPKTMTLCSSRKEAVEKMQIMACLHGYTAHLRSDNKEREKPTWILSLTPQDWRSIQIGGKTTNRPRVIMENSQTKEKVWCIETGTGTIITRRKGKITVMGNCQYLGRGSRPTETKMSPDSNGRPRGCLVLDYVGNIAKHGPIDAVRIKRPAPKKPPPTRDCPKCETTVPIQARVCPACGADLSAEPAEEDRPVLNDKAIIAALDKNRQRRVETREITGADYRLHLGQSGRYTVRVDYRDGLMPVASEWLCFDHPAGSYARLKADKWFVDRVGHNCVPPPDCKTFLDWIDMGMSPSVPAGLRLLFDPAKKYPEILGHEWSSPSERAGAFEKAVA